MKETFHCEVLWYFRDLIYGPPPAVAGFDNWPFLAPRVLLLELAVEACDRPISLTAIRDSIRNSESCNYETGQVTRIAHLVNRWKTRNGEPEAVCLDGPSRQLMGTVAAIMQAKCKSRKSLTQASTVGNDKESLNGRGPNTARVVGLAAIMAQR